MIAVRSCEGELEALTVDQDYNNFLNVGKK